MTACSMQDLRELAEVMTPVELARDEVLVRTGDEASQAWVLLSGELDVELRDKLGKSFTIGTVTPGALVGEVALLSSGVRTTCLRARTTCELARISKADFNTLQHSQPHTWRVLSEQAIHRIRNSRLLRALDQLFGPFQDETACREIAKIAETRQVDAGEALFAQGDEADAVWIVLNGLVRITRTLGGEEHLICELGRGEAIGEVSLLTGGERTASAYAMRDSDLARLPHGALLECMLKYPETLLGLSSLLARRLSRKSSTQGLKPIRCLSLVPLHASVPAQEIAESIRGALASCGSIEIVSRATVDAALGRPGVSLATDDISRALVTCWLESREVSVDMLLCVADPVANVWTARCARQCDRTLLLADASRGPEPTSVEEIFRERSKDPRTPRRDLVLVHPEGTDRPRGTASWLDQRTVHEVLHVRRGDRADMGRLARISTDQANALVIGGGGARGFAHLGLLMVLEELGIPIDMIGGTSIGAPIAAFLAQGNSAQECCELTHAAFRGLLDYTLPITSLLNGKNITTTINNQAQDWEIEDLWIPWFCISTNLTMGCEVSHTRGNLARAVRASVSIPGVLPPVPYNDDLLVDGGVLNNLPIDVMRRRNPHGVLIAADVAALRGPRASRDQSLSHSGWTTALKTVNPFSKTPKLIGLASVLMRSMTLGSEKVRAQALEDNLTNLYLNIKVSGIGLLDFEMVEQGMKIGYDTTRDKVLDWMRGEGAHHIGIPECEEEG